MFDKKLLTLPMTPRSARLFGFANKCRQTTYAELKVENSQTFISNKWQWVGMESIYFFKRKNQRRYERIAECAYPPTRP